MDNDRRLEPGAGPVLGDAPLPAIERQWTLLVYMAGDNNLESYGWQDLDEIKSVGSTPEVAVVAQFDQMAKGATKRYYLRAGTTLEEDELEGPPGDETNTGDPRDLARFLQWGIESYPAARYGLVIWNHGTGWKEDDLYGTTALSDVVRDDERRHRMALVKTLLRSRRVPPLFTTSVDEMLSKGIAFDDTSLDFLDNSELQRAIEAGLLFAGVERLSLLGFDACLMSMVEVAYQVHLLADYMVGSQETEPGAGWPYGRILKALTAQPDMPPEELGAAIVDGYVNAYDDDADLTQSVLDLALCESLRVMLDRLCEHVIDNARACEFIIGRAFRRAQSFADPDYKDLTHLCRLIAEYAAEIPELAARAQDVILFLEQAGPGAFVYAEGHRGARTLHARGVSIYCPIRTISPYYENLEFARQSRWHELLRTYLAD